MTSSTVSETALAQIFTEARTHHRWKPEAIELATLERLYATFKWGPTSVNSNPARILFITSEAMKERLYPTLLPSNVEQVRSAPVVAVVCYDEHDTERLPQLFPAYDAKPLFDADAKLRQDTAFRNSSLQAAYLILAARALGLDVCPMSGFNNDALDQALLLGTHWRSNFLCVLGHGEAQGVYPRGPRLEFDEACRVV
jgi:3-hydroxypropanoate dehydrogenase